MTSVQYRDDKILIVEDSTFNAEVLSMAVSSLASVSCVGSGEEALERLAVEDFDVILLDIMLPDIDGFEVCRRIIEQKKQSAPAIIFVTSLEATEDEEKGLSLGAVDYLYKPTANSIVRARVSIHLQLSRARRELLALNEELKHLSSTDPLTGVYNRRYFFEQMEKEIVRAGRYNQDYALLALDLDHFKLINDNYGHDKGDAVLKGVAASWSKVLRSHDVLGRTGGEEFLIFLPHTDMEQAITAAQRLLKATRELAIHDANDGTLNITASIGIAVNAPDCSKTLAICADKALYRAKACGRDRAVCCTPAPQCCQSSEKAAQ